MKKKLKKNLTRIHGTSSKGHSEEVQEKSEHGSNLTMPVKKNQFQVITKNVEDGDMRKDDVRILEMKTTRIITKTETKHSTRTIMVYFAIEGKWKEIPLEKFL